jgi:hypothetical protein
MKKAGKSFDKILYFGAVSLASFAVFLWEFIKTSDECPRGGGIFFIAGNLSLIIFLAGLNVSRMAKRGRSKRWTMTVNAVLVLLLLAMGLYLSVILFFCLTF